MLINKKDIVHIIGIGGIGMSGIAEIMSDMGYKVQGSDISKNNNTDRLTKKGIKVFIGHKSKNINQVNIVFFLYNNALSSDTANHVNSSSVTFSWL